MNGSAEVDDQQTVIVFLAEKAENETFFGDYGAIDRSTLSLRPSERRILAPELDQIPVHPPNHSTPQISLALAMVQLAPLKCFNVMWYG